MPAGVRRARAVPKQDQKKKSRAASPRQKLHKKQDRTKPNRKKAELRAPLANSIVIDVLVESARWKDFADESAIVRRAVMAAAEVLSAPRVELAIVLTDDSAVRDLNRTWRGIDAATNVLSFPAEFESGSPPLLGDIVLACETVAAEAKAERKPFAHHLAHLAVHGFLHLLGYDHERNKDALIMEQAERNILQRLAIPDPYRPRTKARV
jgi:probable rRNA maturation factor